MEYRPTIGLEVHAELKTATKMFCRCTNNPDEERPNVNVCPVCLAHPGTLPVINREAVKHVLRVGSAVGGTLADFSEFDRKSYFYPDIPKGYQISQYEYPLVTGGELAGVKLTRVHLEEDTARSTHLSTSLETGSEGKTLVDYNRAGVPLMELVTEPVIHDALTAGRFARELQLLLRTLGAGEANLEKGEMRVEANISVSPDLEKFGTKVEIKNLNSFRSVERAIAYEIDRQTKALESGGSVVQETRGWNEATQETFHQRFKEGSADYRYFPEPDLPKLSLREVADLAPETLSASLPELPWARRTRYQESFGLRESDVTYLVAAPMRSAFFDTVSAALGNDSALVALAANYIVSDLAGIYAKKGNESYASLDAALFAKLIKLTHEGVLSSRGAKDVLALFVETGQDPEALAREHGLLQVSDPAALEGVVQAVIAEEAAAATEFKAGKEAALQYLVGKAMKRSKGAGNPALLRELLQKALS